VREHSRKLFIVSAPIIGENEHRKYFTHEELIGIFHRHRFSLVEYRNVYVLPIGTLRTIAAAAVRMPLCLWLMDLIPKSLVYQRVYIVEVP
jgi:hypothetical protein